MGEEGFMVGTDPRNSQGMPHWITNRLPTAADADCTGYVNVPSKPGEEPLAGAGWWQHHTLVVPGQPWWSANVPVSVEPAAAPTPAPTRKVVQIAASSALDLFALCDDGTIWMNNSIAPTWAQLPAIPQEGLI